MCYIGVKEGNIEKFNKKRRQNEDDHINFHLQNTFCLPEGVHENA